MAEDLFIPMLGQTVEEVVLINWLVNDGEKVDFGDPVLEVETDKAIFNVEANAKGYIHFGNYKIGETVPVLTVVASIGKKDEGFSPSAASIVEEEAPVEISQPEKELSQEVKDSSQPMKEESRKVFASPRARKLARVKGVDLALVKPTGGEGTRITEADVLAYFEHAPSATPIAAAFAREMNFDISGLRGSGPKGMITRSDVEDAIRQRLAAKSGAISQALPEIKYAPAKVSERKPLTGVQKIIFDRMGASDQLTARVTLVTEVDAVELVAIREKLAVEKEGDWGFKPGYNDLIGMVVAKALREFHYMNARVSADGLQIEFLENVNLGLAVDTERGLMVPVIKDADQLDLPTFGHRLRSLVEQAKSGQISPDDLSGGTFTITNLGVYDVDAFTPVINLPELAILGIGRIQDKVVPFEGKASIRKMMTLSLVFDHRLVDGAPAAKFLQEIKQLIESSAMTLK
jgi:pyruvate dehydrogenase E2 component (dihydrolipoamide acetyltransferase)